MAEKPAFVDVRKVFVEYSLPAHPLASLLGRKPSTHSVLRDVSFQLPHGAHVTLFGKAGSGKTTLLRVLAGAIAPRRGTVFINGKILGEQKDLAAGYVSAEESEPRKETVNDVLHGFGLAHRVANLPSRIGAMSEVLDLGPVRYRTVSALSATERTRVNIARAALSDAPVVLFDDTADELGAQALAGILDALFEGRTSIASTRFPSTAEQLELPLLILHDSTITNTGTRDEIANDLSCPRIVDAWVEGLRYDLLRRLRQHPGVVEVRLVPSDSFSGQRLRIRVQSARYLPSLYDLVTQAPLVKIEELPSSLADIIARL